MKSKPLVPRERARADVDEAIDGYLGDEAADAALGFVDALQEAYAFIGRHPSAGSPRYGHELSLPGLRCWRLTRHPYLVCCVENAEHVDVWRVLHEQRDIPVWMGRPDEA